MATKITSPESTLSKDELLRHIARTAGISFKDTQSVMNAFQQVVGEHVAQGHTVRLMGFGSWSPRAVGPRSFKPIRSGETVTLPARKRVGFSVGTVLARALNPDAK